jgi:hypothetical protein
MRSDDGKRFENVVGIVDRDAMSGEELTANVLNCNKSLDVGESIVVGGKVFQYHGEDSCGCSIFTAPGQTVWDVRFATR